MIRDVGRYHITNDGLGQVTLGGQLADKIEWENKEKLLIEYDRGTITIKSLNSMA